jgi:hypothetical protein
MGKRTMTVDDRQMLSSDLDNLVIAVNIRSAHEHHLDYQYAHKDAQRIQSMRAQIERRVTGMVERGY